MDDASDLYRLADPVTANAHDLTLELAWFARVLDARLKSYFGLEPAPADVLDIPPPDLARSASPYAILLRQREPSVPARLILLLALIPHIRPQLLDVLRTPNEATQRGFSEFGGLQASAHGGFLPTGETAAFLLAGDDLARRFEVMRLFGDAMARDDLVQLVPTSAGEPVLSGAIQPTRETLDWVTLGAERKPAFDAEFPARRIETALDWGDLVLPPETLEQLDEIRHWLVHGETLLTDWQLDRKLAPGFTSLFHGPPGTGKTLAACLLGKHCAADVYKIDLSMIVSKYIGETEKNLARVFDRAERRRWILFFDEADALFGRRTRVDDSHDRFANQEISFLLQRIEEFAGVVILASNFKSNVDDAFVRRFQSVIQFQMPQSVQRLRLWREAFSPKSRLDHGVDLARIAERHELSGGTIMNVARYASLMACSRGERTIRAVDIEEGVRRELLKEGRTG
jgi:ATPase family associated with various cellular activities (AAA)